MSDTGPRPMERFVGDDVANDGVKIAGCSAKGAPESPQGGVESSNLSRSTKLLPCPFCGGEASIEEVGAEGSNCRFSAGCSDEDGECMGYQSLTTFARRSDAIKAWNKRAVLPLQDDVVADARRYRRLQVLGCAPDTSPQLSNGTVLRFTNLDAFVDGDLKAHPSRGEARPLTVPVAEKDAP